MSVTVIQVNYDELGAIAGRFGSQAEANVDLNNRVQHCVQSLQQGGWEGEGSKAFFAEMEGEVFPAMQRLTNALKEAQATTLQVKTVIQEAEEAAAALFQGAAIAQQGIPAAHTAATASNANAAVAGIPGVLTGQTSGIASVIGGILKGVVADTLLPQRFILRALTPSVARGQTTVAALMDMMAGRPGRGLPLIRFDGPHKGSPFPHINLNPRLTGFRDPHTPISPRLLNLAGKGARLLEGIRKIALPIAITTDVFRVGSAFHSDGYQIGSQTKRTVGSVAGGWAGAFAGAQLGAVGGVWVGGAIGSIVPGVGTAIGAGVGGFLGGVAGGIGGALGGSSIGEMIGGLF